MDSIETSTRPLSTSGSIKFAHRSYTLRESRRRLVEFIPYMRGTISGRDATSAPDAVTAGDENLRKQSFNKYPWHLHTHSRIPWFAARIYPFSDPRLC